MNELLKYLKIDDLKDEKHRQMAAAIGMEAFTKLVSEYGGGEPYIPEADRLVIPVRDELIRREFDGGNYFQLAQKWGLSERYIRDITKEKAKEIKTRPVDGQLKLF